MNNIKRIGQQRAFLNEPYETSLTSHVGYSIVLRTWTPDLKEEGLYDGYEIKFSISDCSRNIHLDFDISTKEEMRNSLFKLDTIIKTCQAMKEDIKVARKEVLKGQKRAKELKENNGIIN